MKKLNIAQAAEHFGISKEAIHNRIRRGSLESVIEDGVKYVLIDENASKTQATAKPRTRRANSSTLADDRYYKLLEDQNERLQARVDKLEQETSILRTQKEQMLIEEREKVEKIYKDKDDQLKNILNAISSNFLPDANFNDALPHNKQEQSYDEQEELLEAEIEEIDVVEHLNTKEELKAKKQKKKDKLISLKKYLTKNKISDKKATKIKALFKKRASKDKRIISIDNKFYLNTSKYEYSDLLNPNSKKS